MDAMWLGVMAFLVVFGFDLVNVAHRVFLKRAILLVAGLLFLLALFQALNHPPLWPVSGWVVVVGIVLSLLGAGLLVYSLVIEIPFVSTYLAPGASSQLVMTGTYALTRHPGVLWLGLLLIGLSIASRSPAMFIAAPVWLGLDAVYVWFQDRYFFPKQFPAYRSYQTQTPMLIPNRSSVARCWRTLPWQISRSSKHLDVESHNLSEEKPE